MIEFVLAATLDRLGITKHKLSVKSEIRPNTISDMANNDVKSVNIETLTKIIIALNEIAKEKNISKQFDVNDVFIFKTE